MNSSCPLRYRWRELYGRFFFFDFRISSTKKITFHEFKLSTQGNTMVPLAGTIWQDFDFWISENYHGKIFVVSCGNCRGMMASQAFISLGYRQMVFEVTVDPLQPVSTKTEIVLVGSYV